MKANRKADNKIVVMVSDEIHSHLKHIQETVGAPIGTQVRLILERQFSAPVGQRRTDAPQVKP